MTTPQDIERSALALLKKVSSGPKGYAFTAAEVREVMTEEMLTITQAAVLAEYAQHLDQVEVIRRATGWLPILTGYGVRLLMAGDIVRAGDFSLTARPEGHEVLYRIPSEWGQGAAQAYWSPRMPRAHVEEWFRYTRTGEAPGMFDVDEFEVIAVLAHQLDHLGRAERREFGEAVMAYRMAVEDNAPEATRQALALTCDTLLNAMKHQSEGIWWNSRTGTWGVGTLDDEAIENEAHGATLSGPHDL